MPIYRVDNNSIQPIKPTTFAQQGLRERNNLQSLVKAQVGVISPNTLVVAEEFSEWEDSRRRIDLLGIDKAANLIVIELKRTQDGGYMDLQAIRYAAMVSTLTFERLGSIYAKFLDENGIKGDATERLLEFLDWSEPDDEQFGQEVKIILASAEFSKELTTSVLWLNELGVDIRCVRMQPYSNDGRLFLDVQTIIPVPEAHDYQVRIREKKRKERESRKSTRDFTKYDVDIAGKHHPAQSKRWMMFHLVSGVIASGATPEQVIDAIPGRRNQLFEVFEGELSADQVHEQIMKADVGGKVPRAKRYFCNNGEVFHSSNKTYALSNQWGTLTLDSAISLARAFPYLNIDFRPSGD